MAAVVGAGETKKNPTATCVTSVGTFTIELYLNEMPMTASNFIDLAQSGYYNGLHFHRVIPSFMAQFGCPFSRDMSGASGRPGTGGPAYPSEYTNLKTGGKIARANSRGKGAIPDEHTAQISNAPGTLSMANAGPNSGGSQFFINVTDNARLDWWSPPAQSKHPVFGKVVTGYEVVVAITEVPTTRDAPNTPIMMESITIEGL